MEAAARTAALDAADATGPPVTPRDATRTDAAAAAGQVAGPEALLVTTRILSQWASSAREYSRVSLFLLWRGRSGAH